MLANKLATFYPSFIPRTSLSCIPYMRHASKRRSCHLICYWSIQISAIYFRIYKIWEVFAGLNTQYLFLECVCVWGGGCCSSGSTPFQKTWYQLIRNKNNCRNTKFTARNCQIANNSSMTHDRPESIYVKPVLCMRADLGCRQHIPEYP